MNSRICELQDMSQAITTLMDEADSELYDKLHQAQQHLVNCITIMTNREELLLAQAATCIHEEALQADHDSLV